MEQKKNTRKNFRGYFLPNDSVSVAALGVFIALCCILTMVVGIPVPATGGYINIGDIGVMMCGLLLGPIIGGIAGGVGSALADVFSPWIAYAPITLLVKGIEGFLVGLIAHPRKAASRMRPWDIVGVLVGGLEMVTGYLIYESFLYGFEAAFVEFPGNLVQMAVGAIGSLLIVAALRKNLQRAFPTFFDHIYLREVAHTPEEPKNP